MFVTTQLDNDTEYHQFSKDVTVKYYLCTQRPGFPMKVSYYIVVQDGVTSLRNKQGDFLYDVGSMDPAQVIEFITVHHSYYNHKIHGSGRPLPTQKTIIGNKSWGRQCMEEYAGSIVLWLMKCRPNTTYQEAIFIMKNEGYLVNEKTGEVTINPNAKFVV